MEKKCKRSEWEKIPVDLFCVPQKPSMHGCQVYNRPSLDTTDEEPDEPT